MRLFLSIVGQTDNIGDAVIRRQLVNWLRPHGNLHVYIGSAPLEFIEACGLGYRDKLYTSALSWQRALIQSAADDAALAFNPGEMTVGWKRSVRELALLPAQLLLRAYRRPVIRVGVSLEAQPTRLWWTVLRACWRNSTLLVWRDTQSPQWSGLGSTAPDVAFGLPSSTKTVGADCRSVVTVSMRSGRPMPDGTWLRSVREAAETFGLQLVTASQVRRDDCHNATIADALGADHMPWASGPHLAQEAKVRELYRRSALVVSDRLHVLALALVEGAQPAALLTTKSLKVQRHFDEVGVSCVSRLASEGTTEENRRFLVGRLLSNDSQELASARMRVEELRKQVVGALRNSECPSPPSE